MKPLTLNSERRCYNSSLLAILYTSLWIISVWRGVDHRLTAFTAFAGVRFAYRFTHAGFWRDSWLVKSLPDATSPVIAGATGCRSLTVSSGCLFVGVWHLKRFKQFPVTVTQSCHGLGWPTGWVGLVVGREFLIVVGWVGSWVWKGRFAKNRCLVHNYIMHVTSFALGSKAIIQLFENLQFFYIFTTGWLLFIVWGLGCV